MKTLIICFFSILFLPSFGYGQSVLASGQEPAWFLDWDGNNQFVLYLGESAFEYTLVSKNAPEGSSNEISESWLLKNKSGHTAVLLIEYFDKDSPESCPCFHDLGEGLNKGSAYFIHEGGTFYIGCAEYDEVPLTVK
jgi:hypothetical protein